uniref:Ovoinhibitor-like isoform X6 n=1 Tax=Phascolarctos cinereus TaxID=38626 RepID=A0A6P5JMR9_PHACI|nr:ovoinhibitor-like isoform X6 [Phascolarctos cinereus]
MNWFSGSIRQPSSTLLPYDQLKGTEVDCSAYPSTSKGIICPDAFKPICATDKKTYVNECSLCATNAEKELNIKKLHNGECNVCLLMQLLIMNVQQHDGVKKTSGE